MFNNPDFSGRLIAQHFQTELEKIALSPALMARAVAKADNIAGATRSAVGAKRLVPGSAENMAVRRQDARAAKIKGLVGDSIQRKRDGALKVLQMGNAKDGVAARKVLTDIDDVAKPTSPLDAAKRKMGLKPKYKAPEKPADPAAMSPGAKRALTTAGIAGASAAAGAAGTAYLSNKKEQQQFGY